MTRRRRRTEATALIVGVLVVVAGLGAWLGLRSNHKSGSASATTVVQQTATVTAGTIRQTVSASGTVEPTETDDLGSGVSGRVTTVGDVVVLADLGRTVPSSNTNTRSVVGNGGLGGQGGPPGGGGPPSGFQGGPPG